jgi:hypothetical protein
MSFRTLVLSVIAIASLGVVPGSSSVPPLSTATLQNDSLTPELAKEALLELMRSKPGGDLSRFDPDEWAKVGLSAAEFGWYHFGGVFGLNPSKGIYTLTIRPRPGVRACIFTAEGKFVREQGKWRALPPEVSSRVFALE